MTWSESEVETILEELRCGATVQTGGSRCHTTFFHRDGTWGYEDFDEGHTQEGTTTEASIRQLIEREPEQFRGVLVAPRWRRFSAAFLAGEREVARERLREALEYDSDVVQGKILDAVLAWPEAEPTPEVVALIRDKVSGFTAYHVFMGAARWQRTPSVGTKGVAFADQLVAMVGDTIGCLYLRSAFHELAGDLLAAERDMLAEVERTPADDRHRTHFRSSLERLRRVMAAAG